jgi:hypothetical protein
MRRVAVVAVALVAITLVPSVQAKPTVPPADRAAVDRLLDVFVPAAIARRHSERAWPLTTPTMRQGTERADWAKGFLPVTPFPVMGTSFHGWTLDQSSRNRADLVLLVHLRKGGPVGAVSFDITVRKIHGRWLVDSAVPAATFAAAGSSSKILAQPDFGPGGAAAYSKVAYSRTGRVSAKWILIIPAILLGLVVVTPVAVIGAHHVRDRRVRRARAEDDRRRVFRNLPERPN